MRETGGSNRFLQLALLFIQSLRILEKLKFLYNQKKEEITSPTTDISA